MLELCGIWMYSPGEEVDAACNIVGDGMSTYLQLVFEEITLNSSKLRCGIF